ncbi:hypothetical protein TNCV_734111 [Trichonephila clavipes]|nr:hypothetical protein TNCV_734111 [Trichonephila clavipes]
MNWIVNIIRMPDDNAVKKILLIKATRIRQRGRLAEMDRFSGIRLWDYKQENLENKSEQEVNMEESSKDSRGDVLPDIMRMIS